MEQQRQSAVDKTAIMSQRFSAAPTSTSTNTTTYDDLDEKDIDFSEEFTLPRDHVPHAPLDTSKIQMTTMDTPISSSNIGFMLLKKMGWREDTGLGRDGTGIVDPIRLQANNVFLGVGKQEEVDAYTNDIKRRALDTELTFTAEETKQREEKAEKVNAIKQELAEIKKTYYCELCNKQYKMIMEYETHLDSYDHHHRKRAVETKSSLRARAPKRDLKAETDREMQQMMMMAKAAAARSAPPPPPPNIPQPQPPQPVNTAFGQEINSLINQNEINSLLLTQAEIYQQFIDCNHTLETFNDFSNTMYMSLSVEYDKHTRMLKEIKRDLDIVFRRIRQTKTMLASKFPDSTSSF
eukprot:TRINITY_DN1456_c0_g1_i2.p1 TRINITY_DN1456_c0_g1~~TRINITY_DN1456_c0_g1_i2.p1  ORF type:complete len:351 (-),score=110.97 TRINITY_DN1456_c0_g1_i2:83-1135(-)